MNLERAAMRGRLAELEQKRLRLRNSIQGNADAIRGKLNTMLCAPDDLDVPVIDELFDHLKNAWTDLALANADIARLERELR